MEENTGGTQAPLSSPPVQTAPPVNPIPESTIPPAETPTVPPQGPKSNTILWVAVILLVLSALGAGAFYVVSSGLLTPKTSSSPTPIESATPAPTPTPDPTVNWKTYTDTKYGLSFNHPNLDDTCCRLAGAISDNPVHIVTLADKSTGRPNTDAPFDGLAVYIVPNKNNLTLVQYIEKEKVALISNFESMADPGQINQGVTTKTSINGLPATVLSNYSWDGITRIYFKSNNNSFIFEISKKEESPNHFTSFDQILSTFKFLEATPSPTPSATP